MFFLTYKDILNVVYTMATQMPTAPMCGPVSSPNLLFLKNRDSGGPSGYGWVMLTDQFGEGKR